MPSVRAVTAPSSVPAWPREGRAGGPPASPAHEEMFYGRWRPEEGFSFSPTSPEEPEADRGTGVCPVAARAGGSPLGFAEGASFYMEMKNLG